MGFFKMLEVKRQTINGKLEKFAINYNYAVIYDGDNQSYHLPTLTRLIADTVNPSNTDNQFKIRKTLQWSKLSDNLKAQYTERLQSLVSSLQL